MGTNPGCRYGDLGEFGHCSCAGVYCATKTTPEQDEARHQAMEKEWAETTAFFAERERERRAMPCNQHDWYDVDEQWLPPKKREPERNLYCDCGGTRAQVMPITPYNPPRECWVCDKCTEAIYPFVDDPNARPPKRDATKTPMPFAVVPPSGLSEGGCCHTGVAWFPLKQSKMPELLWRTLNKTNPRPSQWYRYWLGWCPQCGSLGFAIDDGRNGCHAHGAPNTGGTMCWVYMEAKRPPERTLQGFPRA